MPFYALYQKTEHGLYRTGIIKRANSPEQALRSFARNVKFFQQFNKFQGEANTSAFRTNQWVLRERRRHADWPVDIEVVVYPKRFEWLASEMEVYYFKPSLDGYINHYRKGRHDSFIPKEEFWEIPADEIGETIY